MKIFALLPWIDWLALVAFLALWVGYGRFSRELGKRRPSLASTLPNVKHAGRNAGIASAFVYLSMRAEFFPDGDIEPNFIVNLGYGNDDNLFPRSPRLTFDEAARIV